MKPLILLLFLCSCNPCKHLQQGDRVNVGSVHGIVLKNDQGERRLLILIDSNRGLLYVMPTGTFETINYREAK
jgi:hypothetical protein